MPISKKQSIVSMSAFILSLLIILILNYISFGAYQDAGLRSVISVDALVFLLIGTMLLGVSFFTFLQLSAYKTGKLFAMYTFFLGLAISLAPCAQLNKPFITVLWTVCAFGSSLLLFEVIGYLTLTTERKLFKVLRAVLAAAILAGIATQIAALFSIHSAWTYIVSANGMNSCTFLSALFSIFVMLMNYKKCNSFAQKQAKVLLTGIGSGVLLYLAASVIPTLYLVQPQAGKNTQVSIINLSLSPAETITPSVPLLLLSGISIAIIYLLIRREFMRKYAKIKLGYYLLMPIYFIIPNGLLLAYTNSPPWLLICIILFLSFPIGVIGYERIKSGTGDTEEQTYQWRLLEEVEKEKQELSSYLHDEVLQSLIAFYRTIQADGTERYNDMKKPLSNLISEIRQVSHNLYPTMVEDLGLEQSLHIFMDELQAHYPEICISLEYELKTGILPKPFALTVYRIIKELATNAAKHSGTSEILCSLLEDVNGYYIRIKDSGKGFSLPQNPDLLNAPHMGLYTVKKQIRELRGQISFNSNSHEGTDYHIFFPKEVSNDNT